LRQAHRRRADLLPAAFFALALPWNSGREPFIRDWHPGQDFAYLLTL